MIFAPLPIFFLMFLIQRLASGRDQGDQGQASLLPGNGLPWGGESPAPRPLFPGHRVTREADDEGGQELPLPPGTIVHLGGRNDVASHSSLPGGHEGGPGLESRGVQAHEGRSSHCSRHQEVSSLVETVRGRSVYIENVNCDPIRILDSVMSEVLLIKGHFIKTIIKNHNIGASDYNKSTPTPTLGS